MGVSYQTVLWNKNKKRYDRWIVIAVVLFLVLFAGVTIAVNGDTSVETLIIRAFGVLAIALLHIILVIGPLARLNPAFLPLLYNRRHLGVSMFLAALIHGGFSLFQFHALGDVNPIRSLFTSNMEYDSLTEFPFQVLGFFALIILFLMAATSHDFWLKNLSPKVWKRLHMMVYLAYGLIIMHVFLGAFQQQESFLAVGVLSIGFLGIAGLHITVGMREVRRDKSQAQEARDGYVLVCQWDEIPEDRAKIFTLKEERIAIFKYEGKLSAVSNRCKHQGGPLGEGKIVDGCITCPWHGYQYLPHNGQSPPPFTEKIATYRLRVEGTKVYVHPEALEEGTEVTPLLISN